MVYFTVSKNINIKIADSSLVKLYAQEDKNNFDLEKTYITNYNDIDSLKDIFEKVADGYKLYVEDEKRFSSLKAFPRELGIENKNEFNILTYSAHPELNQEPVDIFSQITTFKKDIKVAIVGGVGKNIGEMICGLTAIRLLKQKLESKFKNVSIDLYIQSSDNKFYIRDKEILKNGIGINRVFPLPMNIKTLCSYDFYIDTSSIEKTDYFQYLPFTDSYLYKFGIDYKQILDSQKFNKLRYNRTYKPSEELRSKISSLKSHGKLVLFHPYSPDITRSIPRDIAAKLVRKLIKKLPDHTIVTTLKIEALSEKNKDRQIDDEHFEDISTLSKTFFDFAYIISNMDKIITVDTSTYHIADIYFVPTVAIFADEQIAIKRSKYYHNVKYTLLEKSETKSFSSLKFETPELSINTINSWKKLKAKDILKEFDKLD